MHGLAPGIKAHVFLLFAVTECVSHSGFPFSEESPSIPLTLLILFSRGPQALWKCGERFIPFLQDILQLLHAT